MMTHIDQTVFAELLDSLGGDKEFLAELLVTFYDDTPQQIAYIREGLADDDADLVRRAAHSIKSNSATFGAMQLHVICKALEDESKQGDLSNAAHMADDIEAEFGLAKEMLRVASGA